MVATKYLSPGYSSSVILLWTAPKTLLVPSTPGLQPPETQGLALPSLLLLHLIADSHCSHNLLVITLSVEPKEKSSVPVDKHRVRDGIYTAVLQPHL